MRMINILWLFVSAFIFADTVIAFPTFLDFENLPIGKSIVNEYAFQGVHFYNDYQPDKVYRNSPIIAASPSNRSPQVLLNKAFDTEINSSLNIPLTAWFDQPVTGVGMWLFRTPSCSSDPVNATVTLYDCAGSQVAQGTTTVHEAGTPIQVLDPTGQAASVTVDYGATPCEEIIDDFAFEFSTSTCSDNSKPLVFITTPAYLSSTSSSSVNIVGTVYESSNRLASMQINGQEIVFRPRAGDSTRFDFNLFAPLDEGKNSFTILAVDTAGNKGSAQIYVTRGTPVSFTVKNLHFTQRGFMEDLTCDLDKPFVVGKSAIVRLDLDVLTAEGFNSYFNSVDLKVYRKTQTGDVLTGIYTGHGFSPYQASFDSIMAMSGIHFFLDGDVFPVAGEYRLSIIPYIGNTPLTEASLTASVCPLETYLTFTETKPLKLGVLSSEVGLYNPYHAPTHVDNFLGQFATLARTFPVRDGFSTMFATSFDTGVKWLEFSPLKSCDGSLAMGTSSKWCGESCDGNPASPGDTNWCPGTGFEWTFIDKDPSGILQYVETTAKKSSPSDSVCDDSYKFLGGKEDPISGRILKTISYIPQIGLFRGGAHDTMVNRYYPICDDNHDGVITQDDLEHYVGSFKNVYRLPSGMITSEWSTNLNDYSIGEIYRNFEDLDGNNCWTTAATRPPGDPVEPFAPVTQLWLNARNFVTAPIVDAIASHNSSNSDDLDLDYGFLAFPVIVHPKNTDQLFYGPGSRKGNTAWVRITNDQTLAHESGHMVADLPDDYNNHGDDPPRHRLHPWQAYNGFDRFTSTELLNVKSVMWRSTSPPSKYFFSKDYYKNLFDELKIENPSAAEAEPLTAAAASTRSFLIQGMIGPDGEPTTISGAIVPNLGTTAPDIDGELILTSGNGTTTLYTHRVQPESPTHDQVHPVSNEKYFSAVINLPLTATWVKVTQAGGLVLAEFSQTSSSPVSAFITPAGSEMYSTGEKVPISWTATDGDSDKLFHTLYYSSDGSTNWILVASGLTGNSYDLDHSTLPGATGTARLKLRTSDGFNFHESVSAPFSLVRKGPKTTILYPKDGRVYTICQADPHSGATGVRYENLKEKFKAAVFDPEGDIQNMYWLVDMSGPFGTAEMMDLDMSDFSPGEHTVRFRVNDSDGNASYDEISIMVQPDSDCDGMSDLYEETWGLDRGNTSDAEIDGDGDGLINAEEAWFGTRPDRRDTDGDGMEDGVEVGYGLNPLIDDSMDDLDGDGYTNIIEIDMGTPPNDGESFPAISMEMVLPSELLKRGGMVEIQIRLTASPPHNMGITAEVTWGNPGVFTGALSTSEFSSVNWSSWQTVPIFAQPWTDPSLGAAMVTVSVEGLPEEEVQIDLADPFPWTLFNPAIIGGE